MRGPRLLAHARHSGSYGYSRRTNVFLLTMPPTKGDFSSDPLGPLYLRPGFLFRRAHQIADGIFVEECADLGLTPPQHSVLIAVGHYPQLSQADISRLLGFDRATVGQVVRGLEARSLVRRLGSAKDRRNKAIELTLRGERILLRASAAMARISRRLLLPLDPQERKLLLDLLGRVIDELNPASRSPLKPFISADLQRRQGTVEADHQRAVIKRRRRRQSSNRPAARRS
jgi:MarR family transcriptional regulator, lower aerobic nicotinate degradation pathway regulator